jgi:hypothetical protein
MTCVKTIENVSKSIIDYPHVNSLLFNSRRRNVQPGTVKKVIFILIATEIIELSYNDDSIHVSLGKSRVISNSQTDLAMNEDSYWHMINWI